MKKRRLIILAFSTLIVVVGFMFWNGEPSSRPVLEFEGYGCSGTNKQQIAKLNLRNTTGKPIWIILSGHEYPLTPEFVRQPTRIQPPDTNGGWTNVSSIWVGHFFMDGQEVLPGENLDLEFPLFPGTGPEQVGICYYVGNFKDGNELLGYHWWPLLESRAGLKDKIKFYWDKYRRKLKAPKRYEVWCPQPVSYEAGIATNSVN